MHGDVNCLVANPDDEDTVAPYITLKQFLNKVWDERPMVIFYDIAAGLRFADKSMEAEFRRLVGLNDKPDANDPIAQAKAELQAKRGLPRDPETCLPLIEQVLYKAENVAVAIQATHFIAPGGGPGNILTPAERTNIERLLNWSRSETIKDNNNVVLLTTGQATKVSEELRESTGGIRSVFIYKPDEAERLTYIRTLVEGAETLQEGRRQLKRLKAKLKRTGSRTKAARELKEEIEDLEEELVDSDEVTFEVPDGFEATAFARATQGMSLKQILEVFLRSRTSGESLDLRYVKRKKQQILNEEFGDILEVV
jgi:hypothetical protein